MTFDKVKWQNLEVMRVIWRTFFIAYTDRVLLLKLVEFQYEIEKYLKKIFDYENLLFFGGVFNKIVHWTVFCSSTQIWFKNALEK